MLKLFRLGALTAVILTFACGPVSVVTTPTQLRPIGVNFTQPIMSGTVQFDGAGITPAQGGPFPIVNGRAGFPNFPADVTVENVHIRATGYQPYDCVTNIPGGSYDFFVGTGPVALSASYGQGWFTGANGSVCAQALTPVTPPALTRTQALTVHTSFQGLTCNTTQFGAMPLFGPAIAWLNATDRQMVYACERAAGDTAIDLTLPSGPPLYDECCQFYTADKFGPLDWTAGQTAISPLLAQEIVEANQAGLSVILHMDERQPVSQWEISAVLDALATSQYGDIRNLVAYYLPGYDGVFPAWSPTDIATWFATGRAHCADCRLGLEFAIGYLPNNDVDVSNVDALLVEFEVDSLINNNNYGIVERLIGPLYVRPVEDAPPNDGGDNHPRPWLSNATSRGPRQTVCFEWSTYSWVRGNVTAQTVAQLRAYLVAEGCPVVG